MAPSLTPERCPGVPARPASIGAACRDAIHTDAAAERRAGGPAAPAAHAAADLDAYAALLAPFDVDDLTRGVADEQARLRARFAPAPTGATAGARVGRYLLRERLGRGAHAEVWHATGETLGRDVAVKLPRSELAGDSVIVARLVREARSAARRPARRLATGSPCRRRSTRRFRGSWSPRSTARSRCSTPSA